MRSIYYHPPPPAPNPLPSLSISASRPRIELETSRALTDCVNPSFSAHVRQSGFRNLGKFASGFRNPRLWNPEYRSQRIWNPTNDWNPESKFHSDQKDWNPVPGIRNPWRGIRNPRLSWILLHVDMLFLIC